MKVIIVGLIGTGNIAQLRRCQLFSKGAKVHELCIVARTVIIYDGQSKLLSGCINAHRKVLFVLLFNQRDARDFRKPLGGTIIRKFNNNVFCTIHLIFYMARIKLQAVKHAFLSKFNNRHIIQNLTFRTAPAGSRILVHNPDIVPSGAVCGGFLHR